jgi:hypothetical protein
LPLSAARAEALDSLAACEVSGGGCGGSSDDWQYLHLIASSRISSLQNGQTFMWANSGTTWNPIGYVYQI